MVGILIIAHNPLGSAFLEAVRHVFGRAPEYLEAVDVTPDQKIDDVTELAKQAIARLDSGSGVLILTDILGATPANGCQPFCASDKVAVLAGLSLPMLLRALTYRNDRLEVVFDMAQAGGQHGAIRIDSRLRSGTD